MKPSGLGIRFLAVGILSLFCAACASVSFDNLDGWRQENSLSAWPALLRSCDVLQKKEEWKEGCAALAALSGKDENEFRDVMETYFEPVEVAANADGLYTGYYYAQLEGSRRKTKKYSVPLWPKPDDLIVTDRGNFDPAFKGKQITGKIKNGRFVPYDTRKEIEAGSLKKRAKPLVWLKDPVDAFFLQTQGSGQIALTDGSVMSVGVAGKNGHPYVHIGPILVERGELQRPLTAEQIKEWLRAHPKKAQDIMNLNSSFIFFRKKESNEAIGAMGVPLTPLRSLAVDPAFVEMGSPLWLVTDQRRTLVVAQDTGGAIKGPLRGDLFYGAGRQAEILSGAMQERGRFYVLRPRTMP